MTPAELLARLRSDMRDLTAPYFVSDADFITWLGEAQEEACRRAFLLVDSKSVNAAKVSFAAGAEGVDLHPSVIFVRRVALASTNMPLAVRVSRTMDEEVPSWEGAQASVPRVVVPDWQTGYLRFWPPAADADTLNLTVVRTPLEEFSSLGDDLEISPRYHLYLLDWVKYRAYAVQDAELFDPKKSADSYNAFEARFGKTSAIGEHWALEQYYDIGSN